MIDPRNFQQPQFLAGMQGLLPTGPVWPRTPVAFLTALTGAISDSEADIHQLAANLLMVEFDPTQTEQLLPEWEQQYGLPDPCTPLAPTIAQRRSALLAKIAAQGGQSIPYFIGVAAAYGYTVTITENRLFRIGTNVIGDPLYYENQIYTWIVNVAAPGPDPQFECIMSRLAPSQTQVSFTYE